MRSFRLIPLLLVPTLAACNDDGGKTAPRDSAPTTTDTLGADSSASDDTTPTPSDSASPETVADDTAHEDGAVTASDANDVATAADTSIAEETGTPDTTVAEATSTSETTEPSETVDEDVADTAADIAPYHTMDDPALWSRFDVTAVSPEAKGFQGAVFDGRYLYFVPNGVGWISGNVYRGVVVRFDTQANFTDTSAWSTFDLTSLDPDAGGFSGGAFDGRYLYFGEQHPVGYYSYASFVARYDTQATFADKASWTLFGIAAVAGCPSSSVGAVFDGRHVYFVPYADNGTCFGLIVRYDTTASFADTTSWQVFDAKTLPAGEAGLGYRGAVFDGRFVYFVPTPNRTIGNIVARYDTHASFTEAASWAQFDTTSLAATAHAFTGGVFDGRYVYFVPNVTVVRFDTHGVFDDAAAWASFDPNTVVPGAQGFRGAVFDGRFVYFVPARSSPYGYGDALVTRYDTTLGFDEAAAWSTYDASGGDPVAVNFFGGAFDGRFVYLTPDRDGTGGTVVRFDARDTGIATLPAWFGSFF